MGRLLAQLVGTLLLVGLALHFIWWLVAGAVVVGGVWLTVRLRRQSIAATEREPLAGSGVGVDVVENTAYQSRIAVGEAGDGEWWGA
jgi:hypothetical protein